MHKHFGWILTCMITAGLALTFAHNISSFVTIMSENSPVPRTHTFILDAGHGGVDGGATSCTGRLESGYNLEIAVRLNDFLQFLGHQTSMIRTSDISVYSEGATIAAKKRSDLKERVRIVNSTSNAILLSIHQNHFPDSRYSGAVVLYAPTQGSHTMALALQQALADTLNPGNKRQIKQADGVYIMQHIQCPGILIECGFLSNPYEEANLRNPAYQKKLISVIGCTVCTHLPAQEIT